MSKYTPWFSIRTSPSRDGVYNVMNANFGAVLFSKFENGIWHMVCNSKDLARRMGSKSFDCYNGEVKHWRGLTKEAHDAAKGVER